MSGNVPKADDVNADAEQVKSVSISHKNKKKFSELKL